MRGSQNQQVVVANLTQPPLAKRQEPTLGQQLALFSQTNAVISNQVKALAVNLWWISELCQNYFKTQSRSQLAYA